MISHPPQRVGMNPTHIGVFIREEILDELGLSVSAAAEALGVRRATLSDLINGNAGTIGGSGAVDREGFRREDGNAFAHASLARRLHNATTGRRDRRPPLPAACPRTALTSLVAEPKIFASKPEP